jgi:hypothetical protein
MCVYVQKKTTITTWIVPSCWAKAPPKTG